jgi:hypothetical protein
MTELHGGTGYTTVQYVKKHNVLNISMAQEAHPIKRSVFFLSPLALHPSFPLLFNLFLSSSAAFHKFFN